MKNNLVSTFEQKKRTYDFITEDISHENVQHYFSKCEFFLFENCVEDTDCYLLSDPHGTQKATLHIHIHNKFTYT